MPPEAQKELDEITNHGETLVAVVNTHPFHTMGIQPFHAAYPGIPGQRLGQMSAAGMVTFVDVSTGTVTRVPWRSGLNVYGSGVLAKVNVAERALALVRDGQLVYQTAKAQAAARALQVQAGDVIRLADYVG